MSKFSVGDRVNIVGMDPDDRPGTVHELHGGTVVVQWDEDAYDGPAEHGDDLVSHSPVDLYLIDPAAENPAKVGADGLKDWERDLLAPVETLESLSFAAQVDSLLREVGDMLKSKNAAYGDAALTPLRVFSKLDNAAGIRVRLDDKLSRIARGDGSGDEDAVKDLVGYCVLLRIAEARA